MKYLFSAVTLFTSLLIFGQNPLKKYPVNDSWAIFHQRRMIFNSSFKDDKRIREALVDTKKISEVELSKFFKYSQLAEYPESINTLEKLANANSAKISKYKTFWVGSWTEFFPAINNFRQMHLIWIPKDENLHMESDYLPKTEDGFYIVVRSLDNEKIPFIPATSSSTKNIVQKLDSKKLKPSEKLKDLYNNIMPGYGHAMGGFYTVLKDNYNLTNDEIDIVSRSAAIDGWPDSLKLTKRKDLAFAKLNDYNYFKIGDYIGEYGVNTLYWVAPGQTFANGFEPKSDLGFFFVGRTGELPKKAISEKEDVAFLNSAWWLKNISPIDSYNSTTFSFNNSSGSIVSSSNPSSSSSSNNNNGFTTTTVNGITVATGKLERTNSEMPPKVKLPSGCASKDMKERFGYVNDNDTRWGNYKKGVVIAAYNKTLTPQLPHVFNVKLQKNTTYNIGVIFSTKDRKGVLSANASYEVDVRSSIPGGYSWSNTYNNTGYIIVGNEDIVMTVSITGSKYYDLRDTEKPEPVCSIVYVDKLFH
ncbi:MAG: hypothetical protein KA428_08720 [Chitinophagaceae bacterium]|nr:hypothetical protein [Chitinophagaceae bacterium]